MICNFTNLLISIIRSYNNNERTKFLKNIANLHGIKIDSKEPIVIYLENIGLSKMNVSKDLDTNKLAIIAENYLTLMMINSLIMQIDDNNPLIDKRFKEIFDYINMSKIKRDSDIKSMGDLKRFIEYSLNYFYDYYLNYLEYGIEKDIQDMPVIFINIERFVELFKKAINNPNHITFLFDKKDDIAIFSTKAINDLLGSRINKDISIKIVCEPEKWETFLTNNKQFVEATHDYGTMELDDSFKNYSRTLRKKWEFLEDEIY